MGLSIGVAAVVARRIGERRPDAASEAAVQGIALGLVVAALVASLGITLAPRLLAVTAGAAPITAGRTGEDTARNPPPPHIRWPRLAGRTKQRRPAHAPRPPR